MSIGKLAFAAAVAFLVACGGSSGGDDDQPPGDGPPVPQTIIVSGTAVEIEAGGESPLSGVLVEAFDNSDENTVVTSAMTDAQGNYLLTITTNGDALDGYLKASLSGLLDTYLYPPRPLGEDFDGASINMITSGTLDLLTNGFTCNEDQEPTNGMIAMLVYDAADMPVADAVVSSSPAASSDCYNGPNGGLPNDNNVSTAEDGIGYLFNVTGTATVSATATGLTFPSHVVKARPNTLTTTLIQP
jgi:hypothetical protein